MLPLRPPRRLREAGVVQDLLQALEDTQRRHVHLVEHQARSGVLDSRREVVLVDEERQAHQWLSEGQRLADGLATTVGEDHLHARVGEDLEVRNATVHLREHMVRQRKRQELALRLVHQPENLEAGIVGGGLEAVRDDLDHLRVQLGHVAHVDVHHRRVVPEPLGHDRRQLEEHLVLRPREAPKQSRVGARCRAARQLVHCPARQDRAGGQHQRRLLPRVVQLRHQVVKDARVLEYPVLRLVLGQSMLPLELVQHHERRRERHGQQPRKEHVHAAVPQAHGAREAGAPGGQVRGHRAAAESAADVEHERR
eukprot:scaffold5359_cov265-Pinguiococcus_pyrenoidosus.AAC.7